MDGRLLVAYATKHGSTREVAERIGETIEARGGSVEVRQADDVVQLDGYDAVVLGGSLYMGRWHRAAHRFLDRFEHELAERPLAVFALGPTGDGPVDAKAAAAAARQGARPASPASVRARSRSSAGGSIRRSSRSRSPGCRRATRETGAQSKHGPRSCRRSRSDAPSNEGWRITS